jgi:hypothetical protein
MAKKAVKEEEMRVKEEREREAREESKRIEEARQYYRRGLMIKYGMVPLCKEVERVREAEMAADELYIKWIKINAMRNMLKGLEEQREELKRMEAKKMLVAKLFYLKSL